MNRRQPSAGNPAASVFNAVSAVPGRRFRGVLRAAPAPVHQLARTGTACFLPNS